LQEDLTTLEQEILRDGEALPEHPEPPVIKHASVLIMGLPIGSATVNCVCKRKCNRTAQTVYCFHRGREITDPSKAVFVLVVESHTGRLGSARLHAECCEPSLSRYRQTVEWEATIGNLSGFKRLHRRIARPQQVELGFGADHPHLDHMST
jgi:hypothetical protein